MANVLAPFGFTPVRRLDGAAWTANQSHYHISSDNTNPICQGDVVTLLSTGFIDIVTPGSTVAAAGIFVGCAYLSTALGRRVFTNRWPGADSVVDVDAYIIDDPHCVFLAQSWTATTGKLTRAMLGMNISFKVVTAGGNARTGLSLNAIDADVSHATTTYTFRLIGIPGITEPSLGASVNGYDTATVYNVGLVAWNLQQFRLTTGI